MFEHGSEGLYHCSDTVIQQTVAVKEEHSAAPSRHCSFLRKLFIFKSLNRVAGRVASSQSGSAWPAWPTAGTRSRRAEIELDPLPENIPAAHDLDRRPITRFRSTHLSPQRRCPHSGTSATTVLAPAIPMRRNV